MTLQRLTLLFFMAQIAWSPDWACCDPAQQFGGASTLRVGVIQSLTGMAAEDGKTVVQALQLAADELIAEGRPKVQILVEDDASDAKQAVSAYKKLSGQGVDAIIGPTWGFSFNSIIPLVTRDRRIAVNTSTLPECLQLAKSEGFGYSTAMSVDEHVRVFEEYLNGRRIATTSIFYANNSWGEAQREAYSKVLRDRGITVLEETPSVQFDINEWRALLPKVKGESADLWLLLLNKSDLDTVIRRSREIGVKAKLYASYHFGDTLRLAGKTDVFNGVCYSYPDEQLPPRHAFGKRYFERYGNPARVFADSSYDTLYLLYKAFSESRGRQIPFKDALEAATLSGTAGEYRYSKKNSFSTGRASLMCVEDGRPRRETTKKAQ